jgi:hypothetical protein
LSLTIAVNNRFSAYALIKHDALFKK